MPVDRTCPECGAAIPPGAMDGLCSQCLFSLGLEAPHAIGPAPLPPDLAPLLARATPALGVKLHYFGDYQLLEEIARGGMGVVFRARQISLNRTVALKLITAGRLAGADAVKRFHLEAEAAARLDHPNIVPIYEIGEHEGHHYFSMRLVEGGTLAARMTHDECRMSNEASGRSRPPFDIRHSVSVIARVARAVHYAHQRGVLHRDLKPGNILLDERGEPHVTDFGLAKLIEDGRSFSHSGMIMGTPSYMSPEQAAGTNRQLTTASDLWSLGAILYELITGSPPFRGATPMEILQQVAEREPRLPSALNPGVERDLETVCLKCLNKDPQKRYASAAALADDLEHWLRHEPILARPITPAERLWRWCERKPMVASLSVGIFLLSLASVVGSMLAVYRLDQARQGAETNEKRARIEAGRSQQVAQFLKDILRGVGPRETPVQITRLRRGILDQMTLRVRKDLSAQPEIEADLLEILGQVYLDFGEIFKAEAAHREVLRLRRKVLGGEHPDVARSLNHLGDVLRGQRGKSAEAEALHREAWTILARLPAEHLEAAKTLHYLGWALERQDRYKEAETAHRDALGLRQKFLGDEDPQVADSLHEVGGALEHQGHYAKAEITYNRALDLQKKTLGDHRDTAHTLDHLGQLFEKCSQPEKAENYYREALDLRRRLWPDEHLDVAKSLGMLGAMLARQGKFPDAEKCLVEALAMRRKLLGEHDDVVRSVEELGKLFLRQGRWNEAEANLGEALQIQEKLLGRENLRVATTLGRLGHLHRAQGHLDKAETKFCEALRLRAMLLGRTHPAAVDTLNQLGEVLEVRGKLDEAEANYGEALDLSIGFQGDQRLILAETLDNLVHLLTQRGPSPEAESFARHSLQIREELRPDEWWTWHTRALLGHALAGQKRLAEAEPMLRSGCEGMTQREATIPALSREHLREARTWMVQLYEANGDTAQTAVWKQRLEDAQARR